MSILKSIFLLFFILYFNNIFSQSDPCSAVSIWNFLKYNELDKALELTCIQQSPDRCNRIKANPLNCYYWGKTFDAIYFSNDEKYSKLDPNALEKATISYLMTLKYCIKDTLEIINNSVSLNKYCKIIKDNPELIIAEYVDKFKDIVSICLPKILLEIEVTNKMSKEKKEKYKLIINKILSAKN